MKQNLPHEPQQGSDAIAHVKDLVCGMSIDPAKAKGPVDYLGTPYYFCSLSCQQKFTADPSAFGAPRPR